MTVIETPDPRLHLTSFGRSMPRNVAMPRSIRHKRTPAEDREVLLGHANHSMAGHYASRRRPAAQAGELNLESAGNAYGATRCNCGNAKPVDKRSRRGPAARETTSIAARNQL